MSIINFYCVHYLWECFTSLSMVIFFNGIQGLSSWEELSLKKKKQDDFILWFEFAFIAEINKMLLFKMKLFSFQYFVFLPG